MSLDDILVRVGEFGKYQLGMFILLGVAIIPTAWHTITLVFIGGDQQQYWCRIQRLVNLSAELTNQNTQSLRDIFVPMEIDLSGKSKYSKCEYYDYDYDRMTVDDLMHWNRSSVRFQSNRTRRCEEWEFENGNTILVQYSLFCEREWFVSMVRTMFFAGFFVGVIVSGSLSDRYGRFKCFMISIVLEIVTGVISPFVGNYYVFVAFRFLIGATSGAAYTTAFVIILEITGQKYRMYAGVLAQWGFCFGVIIAPGVAWLIRDHIYFQLFIALSAVPFLACYWLVPESPRWLIQKKRFVEAEVVIQKIAIVNGKHDGTTTYLSVLSGKKQEESHDVSSANFFDLLKTPNLRKTSLNIFASWFVASLLYYGLLLSSKSLGDNVYVNTALTGVMEIGAYVTCILLLNRVGRRWTMSGAFILAGTMLLCCIALLDTKNLTWLLIAISSIGKLADSVAFTIVYLYSAELFPTVVRNVGVGAGSMFARFGGLVAPQVARLNTVWAPLPTIIFGASAIAVGMLNTRLPETHGKQLPETLEDGENFGKSKRKPNESEIPLKEVVECTHTTV
ncbi:organic cation transporter protein-like [Tubulanus polymorphus]|uniref:organic cation transporter protein-like n=1 Tax=Tubulanus polymorphus TaxID=672921 RepID=UPI003DA2F40D